MKALESLKNGKRLALFISGGSTKIKFSAGACLYLMDVCGIRFHHIVGTSSGGILGIFLATGKYEDLKDALNFKITDFFKDNPKSFKGAGKAIWRVLRGHYNLFDQSKLIETISKYISQDDFEKWQGDRRRPKLYIGVYNAQSRSMDYINLKSKTVSYNEALMYILASSSIPIAASPVEINGDKYLDGGIRDGIGGGWFLSNVRDDIDECISVFSRPKEFRDGKHFVFKSPTKLPNLKNIFRLAELFFEIFSVMMDEMSKDDERRIKAYSKEFGIKSTFIYTPYRLTDKLYEVDNTITKEWFSLGEDAAKKIIKKLQIT